MTAAILTIETEIVPAPSPQAKARIDFYTQERRVEFGRFLYQAAARIIAERTAAKNDTKNKKSKNK